MRRPLLLDTRERTCFFFMLLLSGNRTDCMAAVLPPAAAAQAVVTDGLTGLFGLLPKTSQCA